MIRLAHVADLHCCREHQEAAMKSLQTLADTIKKAPVDLVAIAGDTWDASMLNTEASGFNGFIDAIRNIADEAPVAMIYGTPSHDTDGSLEVFRKISSKHLSQSSILRNPTFWRVTERMLRLCRTTGAYIL
ncbi:MAG: metallophosphoesterase, partial [Treponema sp.]|nr:metallophosphoesterase [Treponema sp.]